MIAQMAAYFGIEAGTQFVIFFVILSILALIVGEIIGRKMYKDYVDRPIEELQRRQPKTKS